MIYTHDINPILISIGFIDLYWYGAMYAISFILIDYLMKKDNVGDDIFTVFLIDKILIVSLFSLKYCLLSECPTKQKLIFSLDNIFADNSPVKAPSL